MSNIIYNSLVNDNAKLVDKLDSFIAPGEGYVAKTMIGELTNNALLEAGNGGDNYNIYSVVQHMLDRQAAILKFLHLMNSNPEPAVAESGTYANPDSMKESR